MPTRGFQIWYGQRSRTIWTLRVVCIFRHADIIQSMFAEGSPPGVKAYLAEMGLCFQQFSAPVWPVRNCVPDRELMKITAKASEFRMILFDKCKTGRVWNFPARLFSCLVF